ncbi:MAG: hypothetical protein ACO2PO_17005 [Candidatus Calescibacterium sp.]|jgi:glucose-6-phosphate isomerase
MDERKKEVKIKREDGKVVTLEELFEGKKKARKELAKLPFEEKIKILVELQKIAYSWGNKKDVIIWKI